MNGALILALLAPAAAGLVLLGIKETQTGRYAVRWITAIGFEGGIGGAAAVLVRVVRSGPFATHGFEIDAWRATLALGVLVVAGSAIVKGEHDTRATAAFLAGTSAAVASVWVEDTLSFAAFLVATTGAFAFIVVSRAGVAARALVRYAVADAAAVAGLVLIATDGMRIAPAARGVGGALLVAAAAVRCGLFPGMRWFEDLAGNDRLATGLAYGAMRAQGFAIAAWVGAARGNGAAALLIGGAVLAFVGARRAVRVSCAGAAQIATGAIVLVALGRGTAATLHGAALLVPAVFLGAVLLLLARARDAGSPTIGAAALGATLPGAVLITVAMFERGLDDRPTIAIAAVLACAVAWLAIGGAAGLGVREPGVLEVHPGWSAIPLAGVVALVAVPGWALTGYGSHVARALGSPRSLAGIPGALPNDLGIAFVVAGAVALLAAVPARASQPLGAPSVTATTVSRAALRITAVAGVVTIGWLIALLWVGIRRGFL